MKKKIVLLPLLFLLLTLTFFIYSGKQKEAIKEYSGSYDKNKELWSFPIAEH